MLKTIAAQSVDTRLLIEHLLAATEQATAIGKLLPYASLTAVISRDVQDEASWVLRSALHRIEADYDVVFGPIRGVGIKLLDDHEIIGTAGMSLTKSRRAAKRGRERLHRVKDFKALSQDEKILHNSFVSLLGAIESLGKSRSVARVEGAVRQTLAVLPIARTLALFTSEPKS